MAILSEGHVRAWELSISKSLSGKEDWEHAYRFPKVGFSAILLDLGNPDILGKAVGASWFIDFPLIVGKRLSYSLKVGQGIGWVEKKFHYETNYKNFANSTTFNGYVNLSNMLHIHLSDRLQSSIGLSFIHFSNGSFRKPNLGLNIPASNLGIAYSFGKPFVKEEPKSNIEINKKTQFLVNLAISKKERIPLDPDSYKTYTVSLSSNKPVSIKSNIGAGIDWFYDASNKQELIAESEEEINPSFIETAQIGLHFSYVLRAGNIDFIFQPGFYVHNTYSTEGVLYHRIGTRYRITDHFFFSTTLKTHFAVADHFEFGITYQLK
jgi:hypothetical protein